MMPQLVSRGFRDPRTEMSGCRSVRPQFYQSADGSSDEWSIVCPKPRRVPALSSSSSYSPLPSAECLRPATIRLKRSISPAGREGSDAGSEILDIVLRKGFVAETASTNCDVCSSPPFFTGSPPSRARNPVVRDADFLHTAMRSPLSPAASRSAVTLKAASSPPSASKSQQSCPSVRVEGFECKGIETRRRVPAFA